jgi:peptidoglycan hydrolase-like protein with peptidoglycan-binding domain
MEGIKMVRKLGVVVVVGFFAASLSGCASAGKQKDMEIQGLKNQISVLEAQVQNKDEEINGLKDTLAKAPQEAQSQVTTEKETKEKALGEPKFHPNAKQIQAALKNAGYDPGAVDGKMGKKTRDAIKDFQKANNLKVDGKVGAKTWALLKEAANKAK